MHFWELSIIDRCTLLISFLIFHFVISSQWVKGQFWLSHNNVYNRVLHFTRKSTMVHLYNRFFFMSSLQLDFIQQYHIFRLCCFLFRKLQNFNNNCNDLGFFKFISKHFNWNWEDFSILWLVFCLVFTWYIFVRDLKEAEWI